MVSSITGHINYGPLPRKPKVAHVRGPVSDAVKLEIVKAYRTHSAKAVGLRFGVSHNTVLSIVRAAGEPVRVRSKTISR